METINSVQIALQLFEESSVLQIDATERGNYKVGNKNYDKIIKAVEFLKSENSLDALLPYLSHNSAGVRLWAASYLLGFDEKNAIKILEELKKQKGIISLIAEATLDEWKKGNLKL